MPAMTLSMAAIFMLNACFGPALLKLVQVNILHMRTLSPASYNSTYWVRIYELNQNYRTNQDVLNIKIGSYIPNFMHHIWRNFTHFSRVWHTEACVTKEGLQIMSTRYIRSPKLITMMRTWADCGRNSNAIRWRHTAAVCVEKHANQDALGSQKVQQ